MYRQIKTALCELGLTQVWLINELAKRNIRTDKTEMSSVIAGTRTGPKADLLIKTAKEIINEYKERYNDGS